jgi:hypothetical protein
MKRRWIMHSILICATLFGVVHAAEVLREDFHDLNNWSPLYFPNVDRHTQYSVVTKGSESYLRAESHASASALIFATDINVYDYPILRWRWKVDNVYRKGDAHFKAGDDYPMRIYIVFKEDPDKTGQLEIIENSIHRLISGEDLPHSSLDYVWASREQPENIITSPYTDKVKMILIEKGAMKLGQWLEEEVNIVKDYELAFHQKPPKIAKLALMNDSDNTGETAVSCIDWIELSK